MKKAFTTLFFFTQLVWAQDSAREKLSELHLTRTEIKKAVFDRSRYQQEMLKAKLDIESQNQEILQHQTDANQMKEKILDRISSLYKIRRSYPDGSLVSFTNAEDFLRKTYYLKYLNNQDRILINEFQQKTETVRNLKQAVHAHMARLLELQTKNDQKMKELEQREGRQRQLIRRIREEFQTANRPVADQNFFSEFKGKLEFPLAGELHGTVGIFRDKKTRLARLKTGIQILPNSETEVRSVFAGEVLHAAPIAGWGPTIIVDHGESYYSVYSHLKNLSVRPGDQVLVQQKLADVSLLNYASNTGHSKKASQQSDLITGAQPGLYF